jgi:hypothetical protein
MTGGAVVIPRWLGAADEVPIMLDHLLLGCSDLDQGIAFVEKHVGVRPVMGGVHPGRGTRNALLSLGARYYLEVIAPDPEQHDIQPVGVALLDKLKQLTEPSLVDWAVHTLNIEVVAERLRKAGVAFQGPTTGSRERPDGRILHWKTLHLEEDRDGLLPFFIEWGADSLHPSEDAPVGCRLESLAVAGPNPAELSSEFQRLGIDVQIEQAKIPHLRARIEGPGGTMSLGE